MGSVELDAHIKSLLVHSHIITYGYATTPEITERIREEIETMWNEPGASIKLNGDLYRVNFRITASINQAIAPEIILANTDPRNNYFRIEEFAWGNISFVDGLGCNTGYFLLENLYPGSTTAAHEYGHTLGLEHPTNLDYRNKGIPGIMYPRGTLVDPQFQYNPAGISGDSSNGGTMHPKYRKVLQSDIDQLKLNRLNFKNGFAVLGEFSSIWHPDHRGFAPGA